MHELFTIGHGIRPLEELVETLRESSVETLIDVRRFPGSRRNPQFNWGPLRTALERGRSRLPPRRRARRSAQRRAGRRGVLLSQGPGVPKLRRAHGHARPGSTPSTGSSPQPTPCFMCAETDWHRCHRRLISELLDRPGIRGDPPTWARATKSHTVSTMRVRGTRRVALPLRRPCGLKAPTRRRRRKAGRALPGLPSHAPFGNTDLRYYRIGHA